MTLEHGGNLQQATQRFAIAAADWLDLSTGISPHPYPISELPQHAFTQLPYEDSALLEAARACYLPAYAANTLDLTAVAGTQAAIELLPSLLPAAPILLPDIGYQEHRWHWQQQDVDTLFYRHNNDADIDALLQHHRAHLLLINPNNPSGQLFSAAQLLQWASQLAPARYLIVDEAFMDTSPEDSVLSELAHARNIIVLRSFGKFFGLAGLRLGFVFGPSQIIAALRDAHLRWGLSGPAQYLGKRALCDRPWQQWARQQIKQSNAHTRALLHDLMPHFSALNTAGLFLSFTTTHAQAEACYAHFAQQGILIRHIRGEQQTSILRFGLIDAGNAVASDRLQQAMRTLPLP